MKLLIDDVVKVSYNNMEISVRRNRREVKRKITIEKEDIFFTYGDYEVRVSYISDEYDLYERVVTICHLIDDGKFDELKAMKVELKRIK